MKNELYLEKLEERVTNIVRDRLQLTNEDYNREETNKRVYKILNLILDIYCTYEVTIDPNEAYEILYNNKLIVKKDE